MSRDCDILIIGGGIMGMALAYRLRARHPNAKIDVLEKETQVGFHASGRNSGVIHAGFYYSADSLKARLTVRGNQLLHEFCDQAGIPVNRCGKLVVARNDAEVERLFELEKRGKINGSTIRIITEEEAKKMDPNIKTWRYALHSPLTSSVDPSHVCRVLAEKLKQSGVQIQLGTRYLKRVSGNQVEIQTPSGVETWNARLIINSAGLFADRIAKEFGFSQKYTIMPFRGRYVEYQGDSTSLKTNLYPVPDLRNPFLGVHFTKKVDGTLKIGPTATPSLWREHYGGIGNFSFREFLEILWYQARMFVTNAHSFRQLAWEEIRKYNRGYLIRSALNLVSGGLRADSFGRYGKPGIRAQLIEKKTLKLVQDFVIEGDQNSIHVLNAVSPGFTCSFAFADYLIDQYVR